MEFFTLDYKTSKNKNTNYSKFSLLELPKGEHSLRYKQNNNFINLGVKLSLNYKDARKKGTNPYSKTDG